MTALNLQFCNTYRKHYDETKKNSDELFTLAVINAAHTAHSDDKSEFVAELCCVDTNCEKEICNEGDSELTKEIGDTIPFGTEDPFQYCCGYNCTKVDCERLQPERLRRRDLNESADLTGRREDCCDADVTTCGVFTAANENI